MFATYRFQLNVYDTWIDISFVCINIFLHVLSLRQTPQGMSEEKKLNIRPSPDQKFDSAGVKAALMELVSEELGDKGYDYIYAPDWTKSLSRKIHDKLKSLVAYHRYKFAVQVVIGEKHGQGMRAASGCLWDENTDGCATIVVSKETMYCIVSVYAVYCYCYEWMLYYNIYKGTSSYYGIHKRTASYYDIH